MLHRVNPQIGYGAVFIAKKNPQIGFNNSWLTKRRNQSLPRSLGTKRVVTHRLVSGISLSPSLPLSIYLYLSLHTERFQGCTRSQPVDYLSILPTLLFFCSSQCFNVRRRALRYVFFHGLGDFFFIAYAIMVKGIYIITK
jgi:hypothetical protein